MARTKQTARKSLAQMVPRRQLVAQRVFRMSAPTAGVLPDPTSPVVSQPQKLEDFVNTQQFSLKFDDQDKCERQAVEAKLETCKNCGAYLTSQGTVIQKDDYKAKKQDKSLSDIDRQKYLETYEKVWICQFCLCHNSIPLAYQAPKEQNPCIILQKSSGKSEGESQNNEKMLIFCIDISGSMDMSFEGKTRLQSVKQAILDEVNRLNYEKQNIQVGLITFGNQVKLIGDGSAFKQKILPTNLYKDFDGAVNQLKKIKTFCYPLQKSYATMKKKISELSVHGSTALGPGLLSAVELASKGSVGSKVILCTDGEANVGMGSSFNDDRVTFYTKMAQYAKNKRVMVNILSLKGDKCNLKELGKLSLATGGSILKIDPKMLGTEFTKIVKQNVIGTSSKIVIKLNKIFKICNAKPEQVSKDLTTFTQDFGNFTEQTQLNFQFDSISKQEAQKIPQIDINLFNCKRVPMQVQLTYIGRNNWKYLQIITDWRELTFNADDIYQGANFSLFAASVLQRVSSKIRDAQYSDAEAIIRGYWTLVGEKFSKTQSETDLNRFAQRVRNMERILKSKMLKSDPAKRLEKQKSRNRDRDRDSGRGKGRGGNLKRRERSRSRSRSRSASLMESDSQNQILYRQARAKQRSRSREREAPKRSRSKSKQKERSRSREKAKDKKEKRKSPDRMISESRPSTRQTRNRK